MLGSAILGIVEFLLLNKLLKWFKKSKEERLETAAIFGLGVAIINYLTIKLPAGLAVLLVAVAVFGMVYLFKFWKEEGDSLKEALMFLLINFVVCIVMNNAAVRMRDLTSVKWVVALFDSLSTMAFVVLTGCLITNVVRFRMSLEEGTVNLEDYERKGDDDDDEEEEKHFGGIKSAIAQLWS